MLTDEEAARLLGATIVAAGGEELGSVQDVLTHAGDNRAAWVAATVGGRAVLVPLDGAELAGNRLTVRHPRDVIAAAPGPEGERLEPAAAQRLYAHYGISDATLRDDSGFPTEQGARQAGAARDPRPPATGARDGAQGHP